MLFIYTIIVQITNFFLKIIALFSPKIKLFIQGRKPVFEILSERIKPNDRTIWFHAASLGEYEQGLPVIEKTKEQYPNHKIIISFFSPSGYEIRKDNTIADLTVYLPLDTNQNAKQFLELSHPEIVFFIKYEYWPNYLNELQKRKIPTYLISGIFRKNQLFFKWYGGFYRKALEAFTHFFVQNESSKKLLLQLNQNNVTISGDTRFDRVTTILEQNNILDCIENFKNKTLTIVIGSSWPKDEDLLINFINTTNEKVKFIIAPHNIKTDQIKTLRQSILKKTILFSEKENQNLSNFDVLIVDTIGLLSKIYYYADLSYVGGGFGKSGIHNILEPATFGIPIVIGPNFSHFAEAVALVNLRGCISISNQKELTTAFSDFITNSQTRKEKGEICKTFVQNNKGATATILKHLAMNNEKRKHHF